MLHFRRLEGRGDIAVHDATGNSVLALTRTLNGTATVIGRQGRWSVSTSSNCCAAWSAGRCPAAAISATAARRSRSSPPSLTHRQGGHCHGRRCAPGRLQGAARARRVGVDPGTRDFDLHGVAALASTTSGDTPPAFELPFVVQGPWDDPIMLPDTQSLILRSPVASPLLNAVKNRNTRDTVRSAIERLTGGVISPSDRAAALPSRSRAFSALRKTLMGWPCRIAGEPRIFGPHWVAIWDNMPTAGAGSGVRSRPQCLLRRDRRDEGLSLQQPDRLAGRSPHRGDVDLRFSGRRGHPAAAQRQDGSREIHPGRIRAEHRDLAHPPHPRRGGESRRRS